MNFITWYLSVGAAIYLICFFGDACEGFKYLRRATIFDIVRGLLGALVWPLIILVWRDQ